MTLIARVRNFQSIEDATITIDGFTVITGINNAGKTAILRAIRGAFVNAKGTETFVRHGANHCTVDLTFHDGQTLTWEKGKGVNRYVINGKIFDNVGQGAPPEVAAFGVVPLKIGTSQIWPQIAQQMSGVHFLIDQSGSVIAEAVANVERVSQLNAALKLCESDRKQAQTKLKIRYSDKESVEKKLQKFSTLPLALTNLATLQNKRTFVQVLYQEHRVISGIRERLKVTHKIFDKLNNIININPKQIRIEDVESVRKDLQFVQAIQTKHRKLNQFVQRTHDLPNPKSWDFTTIQKYQQAIVKAKSIKQRFEYEKSQISALDSKLDEIKKGLENINLQIEDLEKIVPSCPTCGKPL